MASKLDLAPTVRAYECGKTIVVKYYDAAGSVTGLDCPLCHWIGALELEGNLGVPSVREVRCPDCDTRLARLAPLSRATERGKAVKRYSAWMRQRT